MSDFAKEAAVRIQVQADTEDRFQIDGGKEGEREALRKIPLNGKGKIELVPESPAPVPAGNNNGRNSLPAGTDGASAEKETGNDPNGLEGRRRHVSSVLFTVQEEEKGRVSRELHDELGQSMALLKLRLRFIKDRLPNGETLLQKECAETLTYVDQVIEEIRRISRELSPCILEDLGLSTAVRWLTDTFSTHFHLPIDLVMPDLDDLIGPEAQIHVYRILQEALTNIGKHAQARRVAVCIRSGSRRISFSVQDDGQGFELSAPSPQNGRQKGLGLITMRERVQMLGGFLDLWSRKGEGTRIRFDIPIARKAHHGQPAPDRSFG